MNYTTPPEINVRISIVSFSIESTPYSEKRLNLIQNYIIPCLNALSWNDGNPNLPADSIWCQQNGAPHISRKPYFNKLKKIVVLKNRILYKTEQIQLQTLTRIQSSTHF